MAAKGSEPWGKNPYYFYPDPYAAYMVHESLYNYRPGGFHPVNLGDTLQDGRYVIRHKLGYGGFSTVWLARDTQEGYVSRLKKQSEPYADKLHTANGSPSKSKRPRRRQRHQNKTQKPRSAWT